MTTTSPAGNAQRQRFGGPIKVLLVAAPTALLQRMADVVRSVEGAELAGAFGSAGDALDWTVWKRQPWHLAYVDISLPRDECDPLIRRLVDSRGTVVGVADHLWREVRARCATLGIHDIIEKGDVVAFRSDVEQRVA